MLYEIVAAPQPVTYTPETTARTIRGLFNVRDATHPLARMKMPEDFVFLSRLQWPSSAYASASAPLCIHAQSSTTSTASPNPSPNSAKNTTHESANAGHPSTLDHHDHP